MGVIFDAEEGEEVLDAFALLKKENSDSVTFQKLEELPDYLKKKFSQQMAYRYRSMISDSRYKRNSRRKNYNDRDNYRGRDSYNDRYSDNRNYDRYNDDRGSRYYNKGRKSIFHDD